MSKQYRMCTLKNGSTHTTAYIEIRGASVGKFVELVDVAEPSGMWEVISASDKIIDESVLTDIRHSQRNHRKVTDI